MPPTKGNQMQPPCDGGIISSALLERRANTAERMKRWRAANREHIKQYKSVYEKTDKAIQRRRHYRVKNRAQLYEKHKQWERNNPELRRAGEARWRNKHREQIQAYRVGWMQKHPEARQRNINLAKAKRAQTGYRAESRAYYRQRVARDGETFLAIKRKHNRGANDRMNDAYVARVMFQTSKMKVPTASVPKSLIEAKRAQIKLKRLCRNLKTFTNSETNC